MPVNAQSAPRRFSPARSAGLLLLGLAWAAFLGLIGSPEALLFTAPLFLLAAPLALGRYVGEGLIERLRRFAGGPRRREALAPRRPHHRAPAFLRGGLLLARRLAERGPPAAAPAPTH